MDVRLHQPSLSAFIHDGTPPEFLRHICRLIRLGTGFPALHSVETTIAMMRRKGIPEDDLADYCMVGCVEPNIHGKMSQWSDGGHYNFGAAVQFALDGGRNWADGQVLGAADAAGRDASPTSTSSRRRSRSSCATSSATSPSPTWWRRRATPSSCPSRSRRPSWRAAWRAAAT